MVMPVKHQDDQACLNGCDDAAVPPHCRSNALPNQNAIGHLATLLPGIFAFKIWP